MPDGRRPAWLLCLPAFCAVCLFFLLPVGMTLRLSIDSFSFYGGIQPGLSPKNYWGILTDGYYYELFATTYGLALFVALVAVLLGTAEACILDRMPAPWRTWLLLLVLAPLLVSVLARTLGWTILLGRNGLINRAALALGLVDAPMQLLFTPLAVVIGFTQILVPFVVLSVWACLQKIDPAVVRAAVALGASKTVLFRRIVLPEIMPGVLSGGLVAFTLAASSFAVPAILGGRKVGVVSLAIYDQFLGSLDWPLGAAIATVMMLLSGLIVMAYHRLLDRSDRVARP